MRPAIWIFLGFAIAVLAAGRGYAEPLPKPEYVCNFGHPEPEDKSGESVVYRCRPGPGSRAPVFNVAVLKGTPAEVYRAHGYLLGREAETGPMSEAIRLVQEGIEDQRFWLRPTLRSVVTCFSTKLYDSLDWEFKANLTAFDEGYRQRLGSAAKYPVGQIRLAAVGIELDNIMSAVSYQHKTLGTMLVAEEHCPGGLLLKVIMNGGLRLVGRDKGLGCTSFAVPGKTEDGLMLSPEGYVIGRTLDAELVHSWNRVPTLFVMHEQGIDDKGRPYLSYVGTGSAGLIYAGGISGFNTAGIAVTLHQMYSSDTILSVPAWDTRKAALAPVVVQTILREARSIEEAFAIAKRYQAIATWTILVADTRRNETAAIEITKADVKLVRRSTGRPIAQTNHVFDLAQKPYAIFPFYNKYNETHTRMATLEKAFARIEADAAHGHTFSAAEAVTQLANHDDINGRFQPFGTTSVKAYDVMSTVMLPEARKIYMSVGDFLPAPHSSFLGFQLDGDLDPVVAIGTLRDQTLADTPGVLESLNDYVRARLAYEAKDYDGAERLLRQAMTHARSVEMNGMSPAAVERRAGSLRVYSYVLARLLSAKVVDRLYGTGTQSARDADYQELRQLFKDVIADPAVLPYQRALAEYYFGLAEIKYEGHGFLGRRGLAPESIGLVKDALFVFQAEYPRVKPDADVREMAENIANAQKLLDGTKGKSLKAGDIDWVVIR